MSEAERIADLEAHLRAILALGKTSDPAGDAEAMRGLARAALGLPEPWEAKMVAVDTANPVLDFSVRWVKSEGPDKLTLVAENVDSGSTLFPSDAQRASSASTCHTKKD